MNKWMKKLALHYEHIRDQYPNGKLMILFDIDGTILDMRYMILYVLQSFDQDHGTHFFKTLNAGDINVHENQVERLLTQLNITKDWQGKILRWYKTYRWSTQALLTSHRPFAGVMEVIRWFQMQPNTFVGLNTGRPEFLRADTLRSLNKLGGEYKVHFKSEFLYMNPLGWEIEVAHSKAAAIPHYRKLGYRIFAMVDNEPENLNVVSGMVPDQEILLLHADTIFESKRKKLPGSAVCGNIYDLTELIEEEALPQHIQFVWHGVNDDANLRQFLSSTIQWAECDVRKDPSGRNIILRHDSFETNPLEEGEDLLILEDVLVPLQAMGKSIKLDMKENGVLIDQVLGVLKMLNFDDSHLWFNGRVEVLGERGFKKLREAYPFAIIQCPVDHMIPHTLCDENAIKTILYTLKEWGITRLSVKWNTHHLRKVINQFDLLGFETNIYNVPDLETFLKTVLLMPRSITSDFNFPKWHYFGRGSGHNRQHYEYTISKAPQGSESMA